MENLENSAIERLLGLSPPATECGEGKEKEMENLEKQLAEIARLRDEIAPRVLTVEQEVANEVAAKISQYLKPGKYEVPTSYCYHSSPSILIEEDGRVYVVVPAHGFSARRPEDEPRLFMETVQKVVPLLLKSAQRLLKERLQELEKQITA